MTDTIPSWAVPGARVVCVDDNWNGETVGKPLRNADTYTVIGYRHEKSVYFNSPWMLLLKGTENPVQAGFGFNIERFRPAVEPKSEAEDTAMFERIAHGTTVLERLDLLREKLDA